MYFSNRRDHDQILEAFDQTSCKSLSFSKDGFSTTIDLEIQRVFPEYRYLTVDDRLYFITDYKLSDNTTSIAAIDFISKWADTISLPAGTWTLENVLKQINGYTEVTFSNVSSAQITTVETTKASDIIEQIENDMDGVILYETVLDIHAKTTNSAYYPVAKVIKFDDQNLMSADIVVASDEFDVETDFNPQLDLAYYLTLRIKNIDSISKLKTYQSVMSSADYQAVFDYIMGENGSPDADGASQILSKYLVFSKKNFIKTQGQVNIINNLGINDEFSYSIGEFDFENKATLEMYILRYLLSSYQAKNIRNQICIDIMHHQNIVAVEGDTYYLAKSYKYDYLHHLITDIRVERQ
ncbi:hypothetical protein [Lactococcus allomyrinae]|uniref:Uncharacterized protein n=1 Tax=Lactococcus allomyrinae TaxID=2419773 RepID=A0A387BD06_9LACT|nr:hypothetical protein [Lactococcus allomyrinae]AYG01713.1 hypothetical protein D7I46_12000 [Lactococcus allomyrinae]